MKNKNKKVYYLAATVAIVITGIVFWGLKSAPSIEAPVAEKLDGSEESGIVYYYSRGCSHCLSVQKFLDDNKISEKIVFAKKEVLPNTENARELDMRAKECGLSEKETGIPFLAAGGECYVGEIEVKDFFKKEAGIK
ncbi:MAG TPA: hypothetical protein DCX32_01800 [Candidatus Moranbacteria bacterium]|nr:MAG: hypothetical protein UW87_C0009G0034 [Candidatus Moranbacteria bacterium GW2011_GWC2_45_10]KKT95114.1 MAG: hypothetical protein UW95_C0004G0032 [Parcubacteria group bacterium GW2011_GWC1_45_14]HAV11256.1 hypothetical protein [Candidatus Moranbacteria bacterium]